jgi:8-oxo-dGTP diphosphatase
VIAPHVARWVAGEPRTGPEAREIRWVTQSDIGDLPLTPGLAGILDLAFDVVRRDQAR